jgi:hypothetical protein
MEFDPKDADVVALLAKLKSAEVQYPSDLFAARRLGYIRRVAEIGLGLGVAPGLKNNLKTGSSGGAATTIGGVFEAVLVAAIVVEASAAAYIYREQITDFIQSYSSNAQRTEIAPRPEDASPLPEFTSTESPGSTETPAATFTLTPSAAADVVPTIVGENDGTDTQAASTPDPNGNNGNQYGKTPKPERTKDKGNGQGEGKGK